jgi:hypothetical protein
MPPAERWLGPRVLNHMNWGITELQGLSMLSGQSRPESGETQLPTWIIPVVTCVIVLLAVATALA